MLYARIHILLHFVNIYVYIFIYYIYKYISWARRTCIRSPACIIPLSSLRFCHSTICIYAKFENLIGPSVVLYSFISFLFYHCFSYWFTQFYVHELLLYIYIYKWNIRMAANIRRVELFSVEYLNWHWHQIMLDCLCASRTFVHDILSKLMFDK